MSSRPGALQEQYNKQIPDPADQSGYRATVETQRQDFVGADPAIERREGTKVSSVVSQYCERFLMDRQALSSS